MIIALSPYHLTSREAPAIAALQLGARVVTLLPGPAAPGAHEARLAAHRTPAFLRFTQTWSWSLPLWEEGVLRADLEGDSPTADMFDVVKRIPEDEALAPLRPLMREELYESEDAFLHALSADVLKGGPDPAVLLPLCAGLDRFATRRGLLVARSQPISVAQRAEASLARPIASIAVPALVQASAERILLARVLLEPALAPLRDALDAAALAARSHATPQGSPNTAYEGLQRAAAGYHHAFESGLRELLDDSAKDEVRAIPGTVVLSLSVLPFDAVLRSSLTAVERLVGARTGGSATATSPTTLPMTPRPGDGGEFVSLTIKPMGDPARGLRRR